MNKLPWRVWGRKFFWKVWRNLVICPPSWLQARQKLLLETEKRQLYPSFVTEIDHYHEEHSGMWWEEYCLCKCDMKHSFGNKWWDSSPSLNQLFGVTLIHDFWLQNRKYDVHDCILQHPQRAVRSLKSSMQTAYDIIWLIMGRVDGFVRVVSRQEGISVLPWWVGWCQLIIRKKDWELTHTKIQWSLLMHLFECGCTVIDVTHHPLVEWHNRQFLMFGVKELKIPNQCFALPIL